MPDKGQLFLGLFFGAVLFCSAASYASNTTNIMSDALKHRSSGNLKAAIKGFEQAVDKAPSILQRNLALFMLGDCQMEVGNYSGAVKTFTELSIEGITPDERAEALYKIMEANSNLGKNGAVNQAFSELKKKYSKSAYYEIASAFMKAEKTLSLDNKDFIYKESVTNKSGKTKTASLKNETSQAKVEPKNAKLSETKVKTADTAKQREKAPPKTTVTGEGQKIAAKANLPAAKKLDARTTAILEEVLYLEPVSDSERDELVSKILSYQDKLKGDERGAGKDKVMFSLAKSTAKFGELLEACKIYDKILSLHPASKYVEEAYFEAIRLRTVLGVYPTVVEWARAFNISFPNSSYKQKVAALVAYSQAGGKIQLSGKKPTTKIDSKVVSNSHSNTAEVGGTESANSALKASSLYKRALNKMNDGMYSAALNDLKVLASSFPKSSQLWWDTSLVYVQLEEFKEADKSIRKMLLLDPENSDASSLLGYIQYRLENYEEAANAYEQAGEAEGEGLTFYDAKTASQRMKKNVTH